MKKFTQATMIALLLSGAVFSQSKDEPVRNTGVITNVHQATGSRLILLSPSDGKSFNSSDASKPVLFRWTAVVPKPKEPVTYRLKVWQLMQGQNSTEAMRTNQPIVTKELDNITQAAISNLYTGPCRPPYLCDFVWAVEVINSDGVSIGNNHAGSNSYSFKFNVENSDAVKAEAHNKGNAGNAGMPTGKSLNNQGSPAPVNSLNGLPPGQPVIVGGGTKAHGDPVHGVDVKLGMKKKDKELDKSQPTKSLDKELDKSQPTKSLEREKGSGQSSGKSMDRDPYSGLQTGKSLDKPPFSSHPFNLPVKKITYDAAGNILEIVLSIREGAPVPKVAVAGSNIIATDNEPQVNKKCKTVNCHNPLHPPGCGWQECK